MTWILLMMLAMIGGSIAIELVLPWRLKQTLGTAICWMMMSVTMGGLGLASVLLVVVTWRNYIAPALAG